MSQADSVSDEGEVSFHVKIRHLHQNLIDFQDIFGVAPKRKNNEEDRIFSNKRLCTAATTKKVVQRKFPGPAGLLTTTDTKSERQSWKDFSFNTTVNHGVQKRKNFNKKNRFALISFRRFCVHKRQWPLLTRQFGVGCCRIFQKVASWKNAIQSGLKGKPPKRGFWNKKHHFQPL